MYETGCIPALYSVSKKRPTFKLSITLSNLNRKYVTADVTAVFVNNQHGIQRRGQDFDKKYVFEGVHSKEHSLTL